MKKTFALICTLAMLLTSIPVGAFELETVESTTETAIEATTAETQADATLEEVTMNKPGLNIYTGAATLLTFDGDNDIANFTGSADAGKTSALEIVENPTALKTDTEIDPDGTHGKLLKFSVSAGANPWSSVFTKSAKFDGRQYWITLDSFVSSEVINSLWGCFTSTLTSAQGTHKTFGLGNNKWATWSETFSPIAGSTIEYRLRATDATQNVDGSATTYPVDFYWDNIGFFPYYKITYAGADGTTAVEQVLFKADAESKSIANFATEYAPKADNYADPFVDNNGNWCTQIGWATTEGATAAETAVALANEDITLYPVYEKEAFFTYDLGSLNAASGSTGTVTATKDVTWTWKIDGAASASAEGNVLTVKGIGATGTVTATATTADGVAATTKVHVLGGQGWKPGMNILTYTLDPFDFEHGLNAGVQLMLGSDATHLVDNPKKDVGNTSSKVFKLGDATQAEGVEGYYSFWSRGIDKIEAGRPIYVSFDYRGTNNCAWFMSSGYSSNNVVFDLGVEGVQNKDNWTHYTKTKFVLAKDITNFAIQIGNRKNYEAYFDNFMLVPYYKITYMGLDNETPAYTEYVLLDANNKFMTSYTPDLNKVEGAVGYALSVGGDKIFGDVALNGKDITLYPLTTAPTTFTDGTNLKDVPLTENSPFTIPTEVEAGFEAMENFIGWYDGNDNYFKPGTVIAWDDIALVNGKTLTAWCQDLTAPATGFVADGTTHAGIGNTGARYAEAIEDDGRSVIHFSMYQPWGGKTYSSDARIHFTVRSGDNPGFDASEYNIFQYSYKIENAKKVVNVKAPDEMTDADIADVEYSNTSVYYYLQNSDNGYYLGGAHNIAGDFRVYADGKYHVVEYDMTNAANHRGGAWTSGTDGKVFGFAVDPIHINWSFDAYIDYIYVYRDGHFTVKYDTNLPEGLDADAVSYEVAADTGRGGGTNYYLKGDRPVLQGEDAAYYVFLGWATTKENAENGITVEKLDKLDDNTTVYASWGFMDPDEMPNVDASNIGVRSDTEYTKGVRFSSTISADMRALASEYGFIIAREDVLGTNELTFGFKDHKGNAQYAYGAAYDKDKGIDKQAGTTDDGIVFAAVAVNVPAAHYATKLVARTYMKYDVAGNALTMYGTAATTSLKETAQAVKDAGGTQYEENKTYVDEILAYEAE